MRFIRMSTERCLRRGDHESTHPLTRVREEHAAEATTTGDERIRVQMLAPVNFGADSPFWSEGQFGGLECLSRFSDGSFAL